MRRSRDPLARLRRPSVRGLPRTLEPMPTTLALGPDWLDPQTIIEWLGPYALLGILVIVFAECGLLIGFFMPGDSLLFTAGLLVATGDLDSPLWLTCLLIT